MITDLEFSEAERYAIDLRRHFHQYPELSLEEYETSAKIRKELDSLRIPYIKVGETGIVGFLGQGDKTIALRADMDALKIEEKTEHCYKSQNIGVMHACGHDAHMASLLGAAKILKSHENELTQKIKLIFQPAEENCKGATIICESGLLDDVNEIFGIHVFSDIPAGKICIQSGPVMASTDYFKITVTGEGGHAGKPHQCVDATVVAASILLNIQAIISRQLNPIKTATISVGSLHSGSRYNVISGEAVMEGTTRTFYPEDSQEIQSSLKTMAESTALAYGATADLIYQGGIHPAVTNNKEVTDKVKNAAKRYFQEDAFLEIPKMLLGEDFSIYQKRIPGCFAFVGGGNETIGCCYPNHHEKFNLDESAILYSIKLFVAYAGN